MLRLPTARTLLAGAALTLAYGVSATLGFRVAFVAEQVTTVWAPTGLAQSALLLWGRALWPAVWLGAFVVNAGTDAPLWTAAAIATGNTLEALAAAWLLSRLTGFDVALRRTRDSVAFILVAALLAPLISATIGVVTLCAAQVQAWDRFAGLWFAWWLGDSIGALVVGPLVLTVARSSKDRGWRSWSETALVVVAAALVTHAVFRQWTGAGAGHHPLEYVIFPFLIVAAVRQRQPATSLVVFVAAAVAIGNTVRGFGPFAGPGTHESLVLLQLFMGVVAGTGLLLAAAIAERETSERRRAAAHAAGEALAGAASLPEAGEAIIRAVCGQLAWTMGALWIVDRDRQRLRCLVVWPAAVGDSRPFGVATSQWTFERGVGLPGRVWATGAPAWIERVADDPNFPRAPLARQEGIRSAFAVPIRARDEVFGVLEFFSRSIVAPDADLLDTLSTVGNQLGQFMVRKQVEATAAEEQRRTEAILETALDAIIGMDHRGVITDFNPAAERIFGCTRSAAIGRELADLIIPKPLRAAHREGLRRFLDTGHGPFIDQRIETTACRADGAVFPVEVAITCIPGEDLPRFTGFVRDLTARQAAEREREQLLTRELEARREAEAANRAKDEFLATLSHELRTPLNAIVGWTRMLLKGSLDEQGRRRALEVIDRNAHLQAQLVADILDVSGIITGGLKLNPAPVDLRTVLASALEALRPAAEAKRIQMRSRIVADLPIVDGDAQRLHQIVANLVTNAIKFTPEGGRVDVELLDAGEHGVALHVRDDGAGIDPEFLPDVFDRFRQADGSVSRQHGGLGLGLAIVRHLAELHGGRVEARSDGPGRGSTFIVELPKARSTAVSG
ncbi:MAG TPA: MASE1 domain-containing protein [Vicinamibacterales bacterium]|nr:MASE1 domain-containing protein [Vicinamibacterales bacterium]